VLVCVGIIVLRYKDPERPRPFRVPLGPWLLPLLGSASCIYLMVYLPPTSWWRFIGWLVVGMSIYFSYGYSQSAVGRRLGRAPQTPLALKGVAVGFLLLAIGLFTVPHDASLPRLLALALPAAGQEPLPGHLRALAGLALSLAGLALAAIGLLVERRRPLAA
jgi:basic amino acid/polyamine antiporter, APA family